MNKNICIKIWHLIAVGVLIIVASTLMQQCNNSKFSSQKRQIDSLTLANQQLDSIKNKQGQTIQTQTAIITNDQKTFTKFTNDIFNLKKKNERQVKAVIAYYSQKTTVKIDSFPVPYVDTLAQKRFSDSVEARCQEVLVYMRDSTISVPRTAVVDSPYFKFNQTIQKKGTIINNISIPDSQYLRIIEKKGGFFRKVNGKLKFHVPKQIEFQSFHTNPYLQVTGQNSILYQPSKKLHLLRTGIFVGLGIYIGSLF